MNLINHNSKINIHFDLSEYDLYSLFSKCHIGLITSIGYESIPTVVFEMISNGLKVFSTFDWGIPEVLNKSSALNHNLEDDKGKILDFIETELSNFVKRDHSYDDYSIDNLASQYLKLYKDLIK
jgi:glycosyltransferase involved in cell wall biosynthesis